MRTGFVWHERYMWHDTGNQAGFFPAGGWVQPGRHFENPETKRRLYNLVEAIGLGAELIRIAPRLASEEELLRFHEAEYLARLRKQSEERGGDAGELTPFGPGSYEIARLAAGGVIEATDAVLAGRVDNAYALVRPPGHHAEADRGRGFCMLGNLVIAAKHARAVRSVERIAVVDWDVHHGNGTQAAFYTDASVLTVSVHQDRFYPLDSGFLEENGEGPGAGHNLNVPLPPGCGHAAYLAAFERVVVPALHRFRPELILVASGFDASFLDPLGAMLCYSETYRRLTEILLECAQELCGGRLAMAHEGGYSPEYVPACGLAVLEALSGIRTPFEDVGAAFASQMGGQDLQPQQEAAIARAAALVERVG